MSDEIPQVIAIVSISPDGMMNLKKSVRDHLGVKQGQTPFLDMKDEIILSAGEGSGEEINLVKGNRIRLPEKALGKLGITDKSLVGLVQRRNAAAIKRVEIVQKEAETARIVDLETTYRIMRVAETNPMPETLLPKLKERYKDFKFKHDVKEFLKERRTFEAWKSRRILGMVEPSDEEFRRELVEERLGKQMEDGSWEGKVTVTARTLRKLADLGLTRHDATIERAARWLLERPRSQYNPGMFFATDELIKEQEEVIERRRKQRGGARERFNQRRALEVNVVKAGDSLIRWPCGPRIMWTTALVLEALLELGYEENERVQAALRMLTMSRWCDNAQQHGLSGTGEIKRREPYSMDEIEEIEKDRIQLFRYGGIGGIEEIERADMAHKPFYMRRIAHNSTANGDEYPLRMPGAWGGCPVIMTRALSRVKNEKLRRLTEAQLWRIAGWQHSQNTSFTSKQTKRYFKCPQAAFLQVFARHDHPASKLVIMRMIPWMVNNQNEDGSWRDESTRDVSTLTVVSALKSVQLL